MTIWQMWPAKNGKYFRLHIQMFLLTVLLIFTAISVPLGIGMKWLDIIFAIDHSYI